MPDYKKRCKLLVCNVFFAHFLFTLAFFIKFTH